MIEALMYFMRQRGATFRLGEKVVSVGYDEKKRVVANLESGKVVHGDALLYTVGRQTNADLLNLPAAGSADERGRIAVNEFYQTSVPHIYAAGDVIGFPALASTSMEQGRLASCHMFGNYCESRRESIPYGIYTIPEISMVGRTEQELTKAKIPYEIGLARFEETAKGQMLGVDAGLLKLLFDPKSAQASRRPHLRRARDRDRPHRPGGSRLRRHDRVLPRLRLQLPDDGRGLQDRRTGRVQSPVDRNFRSSDSGTGTPRCCCCPSVRSRRRTARAACRQ